MTVQEYKSVITGPAVWVACLAAYNSGILHGKWVNVPGTVEEMQEEIDSVIKSSPVPDAEEWEFHDHSDFKPFEIHQWEDIDSLVMKANILNDLSDHEKEAFECWDYQEGPGMDEHDVLEAFRDQYVGSFKDGSDYAWEYFHECYPEQVNADPTQWFIDWEKAWEWMQNSWGYYGVQTGFETCHVFRQP